MSCLVSQNISKSGVKSNCSSKNTRKYQNTRKIPNTKLVPTGFKKYQIRRTGTKKYQTGHPELLAAVKRNEITVEFAISPGLPGGGFLKSGFFSKPFFQSGVMVFGVLP